MARHVTSFYWFYRVSEMFVIKLASHKDVCLNKGNDKAMEILFV